ncbi:MAG: aminoacyl-tRNA hydrolase [Deltaproteobacteria bacterium]|nr:MAG: aminoacyl-tRNA hydrolase [Deltaproteobacteria bacterium]
MRLLVGLGNPGAKYERTRHNLGFRVAQLAAEKLGMALDQTRWNAVLGTGRVRGEQIAIVLPQTFMNVSGESVGHAARFWKVDPGELVVAHDDLDLTLARIQVKVGGGDGGHNGLKSLRQHLGPDFVRVRFGIGRPPQGWDPADFVLARFAEEEEKIVEELLPVAAEAAAMALLEGTAAAMNRFNRRPKEAGGEKDEAQENVDLAGGGTSGKPKR